MSTRLHDLLGRAAERTPGAPYLIETTGPRTTTYAELHALARRVAGFLLRRGVAPGDRVLLALDNSRLWVAAFFGILESGAVAVPLAPGGRNDRLAHACDDCRPVACIADRATLDAIAPVARGSGVRFVLGPAAPAATDLPEFVSFDDVLAADGPDAPPAAREVDGGALAAIIYTSGSTGRPRGVMLTHRNFIANAESIVTYLRLAAADRVMVVLPFYYVYGLSLLTTHTMTGGSLIIDNRFAFPNVVLESMRTLGATGFAGVPSTFAILLNRSAIAKTAIPSLRYVTQAGGPMPPAKIQAFRQALPNVDFFVMYGATEAAARLSYLEPSELDRRLGSIGRGIPGVELRLFQDGGVPAPPGDVGEIVARGDNIMQGYWNAPEETRAVLGPEGYHTGDLARADDDGYLFLVGRKQDMLKIGAHRVGAKEIEDALHEHAAVHEAAVIGAPDEILGEVPVAFVSARDGHALDAASLQAFCRDRLPDFKVPSRFVVQDELPKSGVGKIDKQVLREWLTTHAVASR